MRLLIITSALLLTTLIAHGQFSFRYGFSYDAIIFKAKGPIDTTDVGGGSTEKPVFLEEKKTHLINFLGGQFIGEFGIPLNQNNSFSISAGVKINTMFSKDNDFFNNAVTFDFPAHIFFRHGLLATYKAKQKVGFAIGAGYHYHWNPIPYGTLNIAAEFVFHDNYALRLNCDPFTYDIFAIYTSEGVVKVGSLRQFGISFIKGGLN